MDVQVPTRKRRWTPFVAGTMLLSLVGAVAFAMRGDAVPSVARNSVWIGEVKRASFVQEVQATGTLVSQSERLVTARASGVVGEVHTRPGSSVEPDTVLVELSNPDLEFEALEAATDVKAAHAELLELKATLEIQRIEQASAVEAVQTEHKEASRQVEANAPLIADRVVATLEAERIADRAQELGKRLEAEREHAAVLDSAKRARITAQRAKIEGLRAQAALRSTQVEGLRVRADATGVLSQLNVSVGENVEVGAILAKVIDPNRLLAMLEVPESRAREVAVGQAAWVFVQEQKVAGRVTRVDPAVEQGRVRVEVAFSGSAPPGARPELSVHGAIQLAAPRDALVLQKPALNLANSTVPIFKLTDGGGDAIRMMVTFGPSAANEIEVVGGLGVGDRVILSDASEWISFERLELR